MSRGDLRVGLVGCGRLAELGYLPALEAAVGIELGAVADTDPERRARVAQQAGGVPAFASTAAMTDAGLVSALVLATPAEAHLADARVGAEAGLATLVEKPPASDGPGAAALAALDPAPSIGLNRRFTPGIGEARVVASSLDEVSLDLRLDYRRRGWQPHAADQDVVADLGPHLIDLARWLSGREVIGVRAPAMSPNRVRIDLDLDGGVARLWGANDRPHREQVDLRSAGRRLARHRQGGAASGIRRRLLARGEPHPLVASLTAQLEAFARAAAGNDSGPLATAEDGAALMAVIDAARASAADSGRTVIVTPVGARA